MAKFLKLDRMEICGFKSFYGRTRFQFPEGITAVVGPNGCGKSNIGDAISWVLGEQKASSLRSERMEDVIFSGSEVRRPLGMAEVSLHFKNVSERAGNGNGHSADHDVRQPGNGSPPSDSLVTDSPPDSAGGETVQGDESTTDRAIARSRPSTVDRRARYSAAVSAPKPVQAIRKPKLPGPPCRISTANTGKMVVNGNAVRLRSVASTSSARTCGVCHA